MLNSMFTFEKSVGAVVFRRENNQIKYLLLDHDYGYWNFPKGHPENGENDEETLRREIMEETDISELQIAPFFKKQSFYFYRAKNEEKIKRNNQKIPINIFKKVVFYLAETKNENVIISAEHSNFAWLSLEKALERLKYKNSQKILKQANIKIEKMFEKNVLPKKKI
jgi:8-oxo-dGTP pyrophosphatase MutT (NUDIX family)